MTKMWKVGIWSSQSSSDLIIGAFFIFKFDASLLLSLIEGWLHHFLLWMSNAGSAVRRLCDSFFLPSVCGLSRIQGDPRTVWRVESPGSKPGGSHSSSCPDNGISFGWVMLCALISCILLFTLLPFLYINLLLSAYCIAKLTLTDP